MKRAFAIVLFVLAALVVSRTANAGIVTLGVGQGGSTTDRIIGEVIPTLTGTSGGQAVRDALMLNNLLAMTLGTRTADGVSPEYYRSTSDFGTLPAASTAGSLIASGGGLVQGTDTVQITLTSSYQYLVAAWDGQNSGVEAWYIGDLPVGTVITMPRYAAPVPSSGSPPDPGGVWPQDLVDGSASQQYGMTGWSMFNPTTVPDGGMTLSLLGLALAGLALAARRKK